MKYMDIIPPSKAQQLKRLSYDRMRIKRFVNNLSSRAVIVGDKAFYVVYDNVCPERSYFLAEHI